MPGSVGHKAGSASREKDISEIRDEECNRNQKRAVPELLAGSALPVQQAQKDHGRDEQEIGQLQELREKGVLQSIKRKNGIGLPHRQVPARQGQVSAGK